MARLNGEISSYVKWVGSLLHVVALAAGPPRSDIDFAVPNHIRQILATDTDGGERTTSLNGPFARRFQRLEDDLRAKGDSRDPFRKLAQSIHTANSDYESAPCGRRSRGK